MPDRRLINLQSLLIAGVIYRRGGGESREFSWLLFGWFFVRIFSRCVFVFLDLRESRIFESSVNFFVLHVCGFWLAVVAGFFTLFILRCVIVFFGLR